jgi:cytochrome c oxidase subunit 1
VSAVLYFVNLALTVGASPQIPQPAVEFAEALSGPDEAPFFLDRWRPWLALTALLIAIAYGPVLVRLVTTSPFTTPGFRVW